MTLPTNFSEEESNRLALDFNREELQSFTRSHFLGSWCSNSSDLTYVGFFPNVAYRPGLLSVLVMGMGFRAKWVAEEVFGDHWSATFNKTKSALARLPFTRR